MLLPVYPCRKKVSPHIFFMRMQGINHCALKVVLYGKLFWWKFFLFK